MAAAEILQRRAVAHAAGRSTEEPLEDALGVGPGHRVHGIEGQREIVAQQLRDRVEIKQLLHQRHVVVDAVDYLDLQIAQLAVARCGKIEIAAAFGDAVARQALGDGIDGIGDRFRRRAPIGAVHLHAKVAVGAAGVVAGREDDPADGAVLADQVGSRWGGEDAAGGGDHPGDAMGCGHAHDHTDGVAVAVAAVAAHHQGAASYTRQHLENRLDETLEVMGRFKLAAAFTQARGAGLLIAEGLVEGDLPCVDGSAVGHRPGPPCLGAPN